jgi:hypothetical protein
MIDHNTLSLIKPKRLYEDKDCIIKDGKIEIVFGATKVMAPFVSKLPAVKIKVKDLWTVNLDMAEPFDGNISNLPSFDNWNEIPISVADATVLSSISAVGEDTFLVSTISGGFSNKFEIEAFGLTWSSKYSSPKVIDGNRGFYTAFDWYVFYYLFQMFKELSGKKIGSLLWQENKDTVFFTNVDKEYFIVCDKQNKEILFKDKLRPQIIKYFATIEGLTKSISKKQLQESSSAEVKHLLRPFSDILDVKESDHFSKYSSNVYTLNITKEKK